jgi:catechol 2,3-dioxygenase-like lactoylglutathione lyase family enzyme
LAAARISRSVVNNACKEDPVVIDHLGISVKDYAESKAFYLSALAPLGIGIVMEVTDADGAALGLGADGKPFFWMSEAAIRGSMHLAFAAKTRAQVDAFYAAALQAGAADNGGPGIRVHYHPNYYAAFVTDPNGVNLEAVCHAPG